MNSATLHTGSIVIDGHCDTLGDVLEGLRTLGERSSLGQVDLPRLKAGGVTAQIFACFVPVINTAAARPATPCSASMPSTRRWRPTRKT